MTLTRLLNEIKLTDAKIAKASAQEFIFVKIGSKVRTGYDSQEQLEGQLKANLQSVQDLITYRYKLKAVLTNTNATVKMNVCGKEMTIAEAIDTKNTIGIKKNLLNSLKQQYAKMVSSVEQNNIQIKARVDQMIETAIGKDRKADEAEIKAISEPYHKQHDAHLVDPNKLQQVIKVLEEDIENFENEVDFCLSEINARTEVEI